MKPNLEGPNEFRAVNRRERMPMKALVERFATRKPGVCLALVICLGWLQHGLAQEVPPALMVQEKNRATPLAISRVDAAVRIHGAIAETTVTLVFRNSLNRPLAGDLYFPLPAGATVSGYALDVNGTMVDGVVVEKDKGRQVFEKEVRKGVDPGLVEWTRGNHFKTRVFPIPAGGSRTVRVSYVSETEFANGTNRYTLPLNFTNKLAQFHIRLEVIQALARPVVHRGGPAGINFNRWQDSYVAEMRLTNAPFADDLVIDLPNAEQQRVVVEEASDGQFYFCINEFPTDPRPKPKQAVLPVLSQVTIFWDASGSRASTNRTREIALLQSFFGKYDRHQIAVNLVPFRNDLEQAQKFVITNGNIAALVQAITRMSYDGGTQLGCLTNFPGPPGCYFLFSDGLGNYGKLEPPVLDAPVFVFTADQTIDQPLLENLAQRSGGALFNLKRMSDQQVLSRIAIRPFTYLGCAPAAAKLADIYPQVPRPLQGRLMVVGRLSAPKGEVTLNYGAGDKALTRSKVTVSREHAVPGNILRRLWAQKKLDDLLIFQKQNERQITDLGKDYNLVTPYTSLIVLETLDQYVEHRILPPASLASMRSNYARIVEELGAVAKKEESEKTAHLLELWKARVDWWNKSFKYQENFKYTDQDQRKRPSSLTPLPGVAGSIPDRMVAPEPAAMAPGEAASLAVVNATEQSVPLKAPILQRPSEPGISIKEWDPKTPYLQALKKAQPGDAYAAYLEQRRKYATSPAFYLDCAEFFRQQKQTELGIRVLSNIAELDLENAALLRVLAYRLLQLGKTDLACDIFDQVLILRPEEPQSCRDLALALATRGKALRSEADCRRALELLARVVKNRWDRFDEVEVIALMELNALWGDFTRLFPNSTLAFPVDPGLKKLLDLDARIVLTWDADLTDMDLHIVEPSGERAYYGHNLTTIGGLVSRDFTQGYGPEEYCLKKAMHGTYKIEVNYFGSPAMQLTGPVTVQAEVITHFGRANEKRQSVTLRLEGKKDTVLVGEVEF